MIYKVENSNNPLRFKNAVVNFSDKDYEWFVNAEKQTLANYKQKQHQFWIEKQHEREQQRERGGGGLEL